MRIVPLVVGIILLASLAADAVESSSATVASTTKNGHSSDGQRQQRFLRSRRVQGSPPAPMNNEPSLAMLESDMLGILPVMAPQSQNAPAQGEASVEENATLTPPGESGVQGAQGEAAQAMGETAVAAAAPVVPPYSERQGNGGQYNSPVGANGSESPPGSEYTYEPSLAMVQSAMMGILPVMTTPENQNAPGQVETPVAGQVQTPVAESPALAPAGESVAQEEAVQPVGDITSPAAPPVVPAAVEKQGNGGQGNNPEGSSVSENTPARDTAPSIGGESGGTPPAAANSQGGGTPPPAADSAGVPPPAAASAGQNVSPPAASAGQNMSPPAGNEGRDIIPPPSGNEVKQIAPLPPKPSGGRHSTAPDTHSTIPEVPAGNANDMSYKEGDGGDGRIHDNDDLAGTVTMTDDQMMEEIQEEERKVRTIGGFSIFLAIFLMIFTAWQMSDNPDGIYAAMCRLIITIIGLVMRILLSPCRSCLGGHHGSRNYAGHMPVSTMDYGYRDPALELS
jgi:hypothetical protein